MSWNTLKIPSKLPILVPSIHLLSLLLVVVHIFLPSLLTWVSLTLQDQQFCRCDMSSMFGLLFVVTISIGNFKLFPKLLVRVNALSLLSAAGTDRDLSFQDVNLSLFYLALGWRPSLSVSFHFYIFVVCLLVVYCFGICKLK